MQTNKTTNALLILITVVLVVGVTLILVKKNTSLPVVENNPAETQNDLVQNDSTTSTVPALINKSGIKKYSDASFGFAVSYPETYSIFGNSAGEVGFSIPGSSNALMTIAKMLNSATDSTGKWGPYTISYMNNGFVVEQQNEVTGTLQSKPITPIANTTSGLPIFNGGTPTHGWGTYSYIVALSHTKFLKISGADMTGSVYSPDTDPTLLLAKSVTLF